MTEAVRRVPSLARPRTILALTGVPLVGLAVGLGLAGPLRVNLAAYWTLYTLAFAVHLAAWWRLRRESLGRAEIVLVVVVAAAMRLALVEAPLSLSGDVWRYLWDGDLTVSGKTPYGVPPGDAEHEEQRRRWGDTYSLINSPEYHTVYPPLAQVAFAGTVALGGFGPRVWRFGAWGCEIVTLLLLLRLLRRLRAPPAHLLLYAWSPYVALETVGVGHSEVLMLPFLVWAAIEAFEGRAVRFGIAAALAFQAKYTALVPATILFAALVHLRRREVGRRAAADALIAIATGIVVVAVTTAPFWSTEAAENVGKSLRLYAGWFQFDAPAFYGVRWVSTSVGLPVADGTLSGVLSVIVLLVALGVCVVRPPREAGPWAGRTAFVAGLHVVLGSVVHPWYLLAAMPFVAARPRASWIFLTWAFCWTYGFYTPEDALAESVSVLIAIWTIFTGLLAWESLRPRSRPPPAPLP